MLLFVAWELIFHVWPRLIPPRFLLVLLFLLLYTNILRSGSMQRFVKQILFLQRVAAAVCAGNVVVLQSGLGVGNANWDTTGRRSADAPGNAVACQGALQPQGQHAGDPDAVGQLGFVLSGCCERELDLY